MSGNWNWKNEIVSEKKSWNNPGINQFIPEAGISRLYSVVRESLQNSIDARPKGSKNPVVVEFEYIKDHDISIIPDFSSYVEYCRSSIEYNLERNRGNAPMVQDIKRLLKH